MYYQVQYQNGVYVSPLPLIDYVTLLERYKTLRVSVKSDFDDKSKSKPSTDPSLASFVKKLHAPKPAAPPSFTIPTVPTSFAGFKPPPPSSSSTATPATGGFMPKLNSNVSSLESPFSFAPPKPAASKSSATSEALKSAFSFGLPSSSGTSGSTSSFSFGAPSSSGSSLFSKSAGSTSMPSLFGTSGSTSSAFGSSTTPSGSLFGGSASGAKDSEGQGQACRFALRQRWIHALRHWLKHRCHDARERLVAVPLWLSLTRQAVLLWQWQWRRIWRCEGGQHQQSSWVRIRPRRPTSPTSKTGLSSRCRSPPFSFGAKPVGDSVFGSTSAFGSSAASEKADTTEGETGISTEGTPAPGTETNGSGAPLLATVSEHDKEGEGEEDEVTVQGKAQRGDMGVGLLRLKKHKETGARRMLLRNSSTGKITIGNGTNVIGMFSGAAQGTYDFLVNSYAVTSIAIQTQYMRGR